MFFKYKRGDFIMENTDILNEIMLNARQIPLYYQERTLDILKGMAFTKKILLNSPSQIKEQENNKTTD